MSWLIKQIVHYAIGWLVDFIMGEWRKYQERRRERAKREQDEKDAKAYNEAIERGASKEELRKKAEDVLNG